MSRFAHVRVVGWLATHALPLRDTASGGRCVRRAHNRFKMTTPSLAPSSDIQAPRRVRLVRDSVSPTLEPGAVDHFGLQEGEAYRIAYAIGGSHQRRVTRSIVVYGGASERRSWSGDVVACLDFALPQGRQLSLLENQLVDARPATQNERGQWVLQHTEGRRRRAARRTAR